MFVHSLKFDSCLVIVGKCLISEQREGGSHGCRSGIQPMWRLKKLGSGQWRGKGGI